MRAALVERFGEEILGEDGVPDRARIAAIVFGDPEALAFLEALLHPLVSREYLIWREQLAALDDPPAVCVTEVPLLYEAGGETRFDQVVVITAPRQLREQRRRVPLDNRDDRLLDDREKVARADFHYVNTGTLRGSRRLGRRRHGGAGERRIVRRLAHRAGAASPCSARSRSPSSQHQPDFVQRIRYPLRYEADRPRSCAELRSRPVAARGRDLHREPVQRAAPARRRRDRAHAAAARHGRGIALRTGGDAFVVDDLYVPELNVRYGAWYLRNLLDRYGDERTALAAYHAGPGQRRPLARGRASGSSSRRREATSRRSST